VQSLPVYPVADHLKLESPAKPIVVETAASEVKAEWKILAHIARSKDKAEDFSSIG
jgi:hypothetical protein